MDLLYGAGTGEQHAIHVLESDTADALGSYMFRAALDPGRPAIDPSMLTIRGVPSVRRKGESCSDGGSSKDVGTEVYVEG